MPLKHKESQEETKNQQITNMKDIDEKHHIK